jgi:hypothetical protein
LLRPVAKDNIDELATDERIIVTVVLRLDGVRAHFKCLTDVQQGDNECHEDDESSLAICL